MSLHHYQLGNTLRGYFTGTFENDEQAWDELSKQFDHYYPSVEGREVRLLKVVRQGRTEGGNPTEEQINLHNLLKETDRYFREQEQK